MKLVQKLRIGIMIFSASSLMMLLNVIILNVVLSAAAQDSPGISVVAGSKQYYIDVRQKGKFFEGVHFCAQYDMALASIETRDENNRLFAILKTNDILSNIYWLSGIKFGTGSVFTWLGTGKLVKFLDETQNGAVDPNNCLSAAADTLKFTAADCTISHNFICERPLVPNCGRYGQCRYSYSYNVS